MARALQLADVNIPLTVYTDCMAILNAIARWRRGDFQPRMEDKKHQDLLLAILNALRRRGAVTMIVWVAAHSGDPGNEAADRQADAGTRSEERWWELTTYPIALHSTTTSAMPLLHPANWTPTVDRHARGFVGRNQAEWQMNHSAAISTDFTLTEGNGKEIFGAVLQDNTIPEMALQDMFQARSFCFPTAAVVSRNHGGSWDSRCKLCHKAIDTYAHRQMNCEELEGAQHEMHNSIAGDIVQYMFEVLKGQGPSPPTAELHLEERVDSIWPDCPAEIADFVPDGIIIIIHGFQDPRRERIPSRTIVFEFGRCYTIDLQELIQVGVDKRAQYQGLQRFLRLMYPDREVLNVSLMVSTLGVLPQSKWVEWCTEMGFTAAQTVLIQKIGIRACVMAAHRLNNIVRSRLEQLRAVGNHPGPCLPRTGIG